MGVGNGEGGFRMCAIKVSRIVGWSLIQMMIAYIKKKRIMKYFATHLEYPRPTSSLVSSIPSQKLYETLTENLSNIPSICS